MLCVSRNEIEDYLKERGQTYITDSSNLVNDVKRNKLRLDVMPLIRGINPSADKKMFETTRRVTEANRVFEHAIEKAAEDSTAVKDNYLFINIERLKRQVSPEYTLYHILQTLVLVGYHRRHILKSGQSEERKHLLFRHPQTRCRPRFSRDRTE